MVTRGLEGDELRWRYGPFRNKLRRLTERLWTTQPPRRRRLPRLPRDRPEDCPNKGSRVRVSSPAPIYFQNGGNDGVL